MVSLSVGQQDRPESRIKSLGIQLPAAPIPLGSYIEAVQTGNLLFLSGMLPIVDRKPAYIGKLGDELDTKAGLDAARVAALCAIAAARDYLGTIDRIKRVVRLGVLWWLERILPIIPRLPTAPRIFFVRSSAQETCRFAR